MESCVLTTQILLLAYYHRRWRLGFLGAALALFVPYSVNWLWVRFTHLSMLYPLAAVLPAGTIVISVTHQKFRKPLPEDELQEAEVRALLEHRKDAEPLPLFDRLLLLGLFAGTVLLIWVHLAR